MNSKVWAVGAPAGSTLAADQVVADTYRIVRWIGAGGMGEIYEATHLRLAGRFAMKVLRPEVAATTEALARFQREANVTSALRHPNIVQVVDFSALPGGVPFMVMELLDGVELAEVMRRARPLPPARMASIVKQIASGLTAAHEKDVVHRDLKPQNVFVLEVVGQEQELIKIVDFGISKVKDLAVKITGTSAVLGTVQYMSPEQARGRVDEIDARTDQFALAAIVYEMLTGEEAFVGDSVSSILYQIVHEEPPALADPNGPIAAPLAAVLRRGLAKDKELRFPNVMAFARALEEAAVGPAPRVSVVSPEETSPGGAAPSRPRRRRAVWIGGALAALASAAIGMSAWRAERPRATAEGLRPTSTAALPAREPAKEPQLRLVPAPIAAEAGASSPPERAGVAKARRAVKVARRPSLEAPEPEKPDCDPNFTVDERGDKHFKPECFLNR